MGNKTCKQCNKYFIKKDYINKDNPYSETGWKRRKYCSEECAMEFRRLKNKKDYVLENTEHNEIVKEISNILNGKIQYVSNSKKYNPDIIKEETDYEIEMFRKTSHLKNKKRNWDKKRKHVLIISPGKESVNLFDEAYFFNGIELIRIK